MLVSAHQNFPRHLYRVYEKKQQKSKHHECPYPTDFQAHIKGPRMCCISIVYIQCVSAHEMAIIHLDAINPFPANGHNQICTRYIIQRKTPALQRPCHHRMKEKQNTNEYAHDCILVTSCSLLDLSSGTRFIVLAICQKTRYGML